MTALTRPAEFNALADRVEGAEGADRELDQDVFCALGLAPMTDGIVDAYRAPTYTRSLDAAWKLVEPGWLVMVTNCGANDPKEPDFTKATAIVGPFNDQASEPVEAATPALALVAAALRALASQAAGER